MSEFLRWVTGRYYNVERWCRDLMASPDPVDGFFLHALDRETRFHNCSPSELEAAFGALDSFLALADGGEPRELFSRFLQERIAGGVGLQLIGHEIGCRDNECAGMRAMRYGAFEHMVLRSRRVPVRRNSRNRLARKRSQRSNSPMIRNLTIERMLHGDLPAAELEELAVWVRGRNGFFWLTPVSRRLVPALSEAVREWDEQVVETLAQLGLSYEHTEVVLVFCDLVGAQVPRVPTVFDAAGWHPYFRPAWRDDCWGEAVNLSTRGPGLREAVAPDAPLTRTAPVPVRAGCAQVVLQLGAAEWADLLERSRNQLAVHQTRMRGC